MMKEDQVMMLVKKLLSDGLVSLECLSKNNKSKQTDRPGARSQESGQALRCIYLLKTSESTLSLINIPA